MVCHLGNIKQIGHQLAHHLSGIVLVIISKGKLLILIKKLLPHIALHIGTHHMTLITDVIFAKHLYNVHGKHRQPDRHKCL